MKARFLVAALALIASGASAKTLTLECGELNGIRFSVDTHGKTRTGPNGFAGTSQNTSETLRYFVAV